MIKKYLTLKEKGLSPSVELIDLPAAEAMMSGESKAVRLTANHYDEDTGQFDRQTFFKVGLNQFISDAKRARKVWNAYKTFYETLTGLSFPAGE